MRLRRLIGIAEQIVASRLSSLDFSNKAGLGLLFHHEAEKAPTADSTTELIWHESGVRFGLEHKI